MLSSFLLSLITNPGRIIRTSQLFSFERKVVPCFCFLFEYEQNDDLGLCRAGQTRARRRTRSKQRGDGREWQLTPLLGVEHELDGRRVVVGVDDAHGGVLGAEADDLALQRRVVRPRQRVHLLDAPAPRAVHLGVLLPEDGQVHREAADGQHPGHHELLGALGDQLLDAGGDGVDDVGDEGVRLRQGPEREQRRVVVVPAELAHHEQGPTEQVAALLGGGVVADGGLHVLEPLDLGVQGARVPDRLPQPARHEEGRVQRRGTRDGEVRAAVERRVVRLGRRQQRQPELLRCSSSITMPQQLHRQNQETIELR
jgi:hypothetical protein